MRYRTAGILSVVLVGGMFILPVVANAVAVRYLDQGLAIPLYTRILFGVAVFCLSFRWLIAIPAVAVLFASVEFTSMWRERRTKQ